MRAITDELVWSVADSLHRRGVTPTLANVRAELGRGSYSTLQGPMARWREKMSAEAAPAAGPAPDSVRDKLDGLVNEIWAVASTAAERRLADTRDQLENAKLEVESGAREARELADQLAGQLDAANRKNEEAQQEAAGLRQELEQVRHQLAVAETKGNQLDQQLSAAREELETARQSAGDAREKAAELHGRLQALEAQNAELLARIGSAKK